MFFCAECKKKGWLVPFTLMIKEDSNVGDVRFCSSPCVIKWLSDYSPKPKS